MVNPLEIHFFYFDSGADANRRKNFVVSHISSSLLEQLAQENKS